jgi:branched-chain amino acid transport system permease protein
MAALNFPTLPEQLVNGLLLGAIYALIALGYTMVYGVLRLINFAHGEVYMLGAYIALFASYAMGYAPDSLGKGAPSPIMSAQTTTSLGVGLLVLGIILFLVSKGVPKASAVLGPLAACSAVFGLIFGLIGAVQPAALNLIVMLLASMVVCGIVGILIERFAYRPMRKTSRIASLITAIGVSLLLQYGGQLFLPNSPPPSISEQVNPYRDDKIRIPVVKGPADLEQAVVALQPEFETTKASYEDYVKRTGETRFSLKPEGKVLRDKADAAASAYNDALRKADSSGVSITIQVSRIIMFVMAILLMLVLRHLVLFTPAGRAMRAVSHDFDSASLMGINVDKIITFTFLLGSSLAGAGAMMTATFQGTPLTTFYGLLPGVKAFVAAVLGGIGNIPGAVLGGLLMGVAETLVVWAGYSDYKDAIAFAVLIIVLLFKPAGLLGSAKVEKV